MFYKISVRLTIHPGQKERLEPHCELVGINVEGGLEECVELFGCLDNDGGKEVVVACTYCDAKHLGLCANIECASLKGVN